MVKLYVQVYLYKGDRKSKISSDKYEIVTLPAPSIDIIDPGEGSAGVARQHVTIRGGILIKLILSEFYFILRPPSNRNLSIVGNLRL